MKTRSTILSSIFASLIFAAFVSVCSHGQNSDLDGLELSAEGKQQLEKHRYLFDSFLKGRETKFVGSGKYKALKEVQVMKLTRELRHGDTLLLPPGSEKVAVFFRHLAFHGTDLDRIAEVRVLPFSPDLAPPRSAQVKDFFRVQMPTIPESEKPFEPMKIRFLMKKKDSVCRMDDLVFIAQKAISPEFDRIPYVDLGSNLPRQKVVIEIDTEHELSVGGSTNLNRQRWFRIHETPGVVHSSFEKWATERGFGPGRGIIKFNPALTRGWGRQERLQQRSDRPGAADLTFFERYDSAERLRRAIPEFRKTPYAMCFDDWPEFMSVPLEGRGTPRIDRFDDAAELAAAYVEDQVKDAGYTATWWEVKNESTVKSEWAHHWQEKQGIDGWGLLADFHNRVADAIHQRTPDAKVGGPTSAYMQLQVQDFELFRKQARFITETRGHIDFFSHHFYENFGTLGAYARRNAGYSNYLLGRYEAILDMLRAHMHQADNVLPILITECGSLQNGQKPSDCWLRLHAWSAFLNKSMQRPDQIELFVPFVFLHMPWNPNSGDAAFRPKDDSKKAWVLSDFEPTLTAKFLELWRDFDGRRLPVRAKRRWLDVVAVHDSDRISLAITNMGGQQLSVDLSDTAAKIGASRASQIRLNYHQGQVVFEPEHDVKIDAIPVDVNETTIVRLHPSGKINPGKTLFLNRWYAPQTATKSSGEPIRFNLSVRDPEAIQTATLIVGLHRRGGIQKPVEVSINGHQITIEPKDAAEFSEFFAPLRANVPSSWIRNQNRISVTTEKETTITSVQLETLHDRAVSTEETKRVKPR